MKKIVTRFAPSPTGYLHIGGLRTALFSFLWAKKNNGEFRLRIEDTDQKRKVEGADEKLIEILNTFGLTPDGEIVYQSKRVENGLYQDAVEKLIASGNAYYCFCSPERLEAVRKDQTSHNEPPGYDGTCRAISIAEAKEHQRAGKAAVVRMKIKTFQDDFAEFADGIRGNIRFNKRSLEDAVILKSDGYPTYHLASVVDDNEMKVTDVIRAEEWLPSAPLHQEIYMALGYDMPKFYHVPLILNPDKSKLSKRQGDVAVEDYLSKGYLTEAIINFIALLGWNPGTEKEIFTLDELIREFDMAQVNTSSAVFDIRKLNWYNAWYIRNVLAKKEDAEIIKALRPFFSEKDDVTLLRLFRLFADRLTTVAELSSLSSFLFAIPAFEPSLLIFKKSSKEKTLEGLMAILSTLQKFEGDWKPEPLDALLKKTAEETNLKPGDIFWPVRAALSGLEASPPPAQLLGFLGKDESLNRLMRAHSALVR